MKDLPTSLRIVACLFIRVGLASVNGTITDLVGGRLTINLGILGWFVGRGLLRLHRGWRTCGLVLLWINIIGLGLAGPLLLVMGRPGVTRVGRSIVGHIAAPYAFLLCAGLLAVSAWQCWVLTRPEIKELFGIRQYPPGFCQKCGYNLTGNVSGRCPECGEPV
jgi:hypothetical protein